VHGFEPLGSVVKEKRRIIGETGEIVIKPPGTERSHQSLGRPSDLGLVVTHNSLLVAAGGLGTIMAAC
jgi:quercetin dioxygenase-like cupin family protein